jgi:glyceraldehyde 3-phosphate dehydrogenase
MLKKNIAINGIGRIGKNIFRRYFEQDIKNCQLKVINIGSANVDTKIHLLQYDSVHGKAPITIKRVSDTAILVNGEYVELVKETEISKIDWRKYNIDIVLECTGRFTSKEKAVKHIEQGARKVIVSAPCKDADSTIIIGVNDNLLTVEDRIISIGSCTTNCLAPVANILNTAFNIVSGFATTVHSYTNDQNLVDSSHQDLRRARSAGVSIIPTSTGAAEGIGLVLPELKGKLLGAAVRVPTQNVSMIDFVFNTKSRITVEKINSLFIKESQGQSKHILSTVNIPLVSIDHNHTTSSVIFDLLETQIVQESNMGRILAWYDNEWAFCCRMLELAQKVADL